MSGALGCEYRDGWSEPSVDSAAGDGDGGEVGGILVNNIGQFFYDSAHEGTAVAITIHTDSKPLKDFTRTLRSIVSEGEARAKSNAANRILSASKITSVASMIQQIKTAAAEDPSCYAYDASNSRPDAQLVPKKTLVEFQVCSSNPRGEILGWFEFNGIKYCGKLVNVNAKNRDFYCSTKRKMKVAVGKYNGKEYILSEA